MITFCVFPLPVSRSLSSSASHLFAIFCRRCHHHRYCRSFLFYFISLYYGRERERVMRVPGSYVGICFWDIHIVCVRIHVVFFLSFYSLIVFVKSKSIAIAVKISIMKAIRLKSEREIVWSAFFDIDVMLKSIGRNREKKTERVSERWRESESLSLCIFKCTIIIQTEYTIRCDTKQRNILLSTYS